MNKALRVNDDNTIQRHEVASRCIEFEAIPPVSSTLGKAISGSGQIFTNADEFRNALYLTSLAGQFNYKFKRNSLKHMTACCTAGGCPWKITARGVGATKIVRVHTFENKHNHSAQEESSSVPALRPNKAALVIDDMIRANPDYLPRQICEDFERQHGVKLTYNQAWKCKEKAKERIFGLPHNSYKLLPWLCKQLMETNSGTIAEWTSSDKGNFMQLFIAHGFSVHGFLMGCRPIISINSSNLSGPHKGALFSALAYDADDDMFPLAYAIVSSENYYNWFWFLQRLKQLVGEMEVVIISGRHHAIIRSVAEVFGVENHAYCYRHLKEDFSHQLMMGREGKDNALKLLDAVAYARLEIGYNSAMENLRRFDANLAKWLKITILNTGRYGKAKISVDMRQHTCTCLAWQMSGIPCEHACAMIQKMNQDVYEFVDDWYHLFKQEMVYSGTLHPLEFQNLPTVHSDGNVHDPNGYVHVSLDPPVTKLVLEDLDGNESGQI
ncbi:hypothetical protein CK203_110436 [Vitis vinifera]|uniref:SWIM-type domain-containing protein n=1 Tax=Vitis vinifera TaxID=29760 RepID=A0A438BND4_VITVI|nr:hypothetical protein CK203_110436 [Vitis vinifera]